MAFRTDYSSNVNEKVRHAVLTIRELNQVPKSMLRAKKLRTIWNCGSGSESDSRSGSGSGSGSLSLEIASSIIVSLPSVGVLKVLLWRPKHKY